MSARPDVTDTVKAFYEETPFPNYDDLDSRESLQQKARIGVFARLLDEQLPPEVIVLEVGCGTGQLTNFLAINWRRRVIGADLCMNSLGSGQGFSRPLRASSMPTSFRRICFGRHSATTAWT